MIKIWKIIVLIFVTFVSCAKKDDMFKLFRISEHKDGKNLSLIFKNSNYTKRVIFLLNRQELIVKDYKSINTYKWKNIQGFFYENYNVNQVFLRLRIFDSLKNNKSFFETELGLMNKSDFEKLQDKYQSDINFNML